MNSQSPKISEKFHSAQAPFVSLWKDRLLVVEDPNEAEWMSVDYPVLRWHQQPELRILVVTSHMPLAARYSDLSRRMEPPSKRTFTRHRITNEQGGSIQYSSPEAALAGSQFDLIILSDPLAMHPYSDRIAHWLVYLQCRLSFK